MPMPKPLVLLRISCPLIIGFFLVVSVMSSVCLGREAFIKDIVVSNTKDHVLLYFEVENCFTDEMREAIDSGINTTFTFFVRLHKVNSFWFDEELADLKFSHHIHYNSLKEIYEVSLCENGNKNFEVKDFSRAKKLMSRVVGLKIAELYKLKEGERYRVDIMAELDKVRLPFYLDYLFFFVSLWDFETDWYTLEFSY